MDGEIPVTVLAVTSPPTPSPAVFLQNTDHTEHTLGLCFLYSTVHAYFPISLNIECFRSCRDAPWTPVSATGFLCGCMNEEGQSPGSGGPCGDTALGCHQQLFRRDGAAAFTSGSDRRGDHLMRLRGRPRPPGGRSPAQAAPRPFHVV